jgi:hypothetical protein
MPDRARNTTTRVRSREKRFSVSTTASTSCLDSALRLSGWSRTMVPIAPSIFVSRYCSVRSSYATVDPIHQLRPGLKQLRWLGANLPHTLVSPFLGNARCIQAPVALDKGTYARKGGLSHRTGFELLSAGFSFRFHAATHCSQIYLENGGLDLGQGGQCTPDRVRSFRRSPYPDD